MRRQLPTPTQERVQEATLQEPDNPTQNPRLRQEHSKALREETVKGTTTSTTLRRLQQKQLI